MYTFVKGLEMSKISAGKKNHTGSLYDSPREERKERDQPEDTLKKTCIVNDFVKWEKEDRQNYQENDQGVKFI